MNHEPIFLPSFSLADLSSIIQPSDKTVNGITACSGGPFPLDLSTVPSLNLGFTGDLKLCITPT